MTFLTHYLSLRLTPALTNTVTHTVTLVPVKSARGTASERPRTARGGTNLYCAIIFESMSRALKVLALVAVVLIAYKLFASDSAVEVEYESE
ncbi:hypothetical protein GCM10028857_06350 [Salinarchaeum chitinilyticum]